MSADFPEIVLTPPLTAFLVFEVGLFVTALVLLFRRRHDLSRRIAGTSFIRLAPMSRPVGDVLLIAAFAFGGALGVQLITAHYARQWFPPAEDGTPGLFVVVVGFGFQLGLLAGLAHAWFWHLRPRNTTTQAQPNTFTLAATPDTQATAFNPGAATSPPTPAKLTAMQGVAAGARTFIILLPLVWISSVLWKVLLDALNVAAPPQDLVLIFMRTGDQRALAAMIVFAVFVAPLSEELLFRIGLFRWLRTRVPRIVALLLPAILFALLHMSWAALLPLAVLAIGFSIAYERSGHPLTPITAHALFNLNTVLLLLLGFPA